MYFYSIIYIYKENLFKTYFYLGFSKYSRIILTCEDQNLYYIKLWEINYVWTFFYFQHLYNTRY